MGLEVPKTFYKNLINFRNCYLSIWSAYYIFLSYCQMSQAKKAQFTQFKTNQNQSDLLIYLQHLIQK